MDSDDFRDDFTKSKETYYELLETGKDALQEIMMVAKETEHPRAYEVLATIMKNTADINDKIMDLNKKHKDLNAKSPQKALPDGTTVTNNMFVGSTAELQKMLRQANDDNDEKRSKRSNIVDITPRLNDDDR